MVRNSSVERPPATDSAIYIYTYVIETGIAPLFCTERLTAIFEFWERPEKESSDKMQDGARPSNVEAQGPEVFKESSISRRASVAGRVEIGRPPRRGVPPVIWTATSDRLDRRFRLIVIIALIARRRVITWFEIRIIVAIRERHFDFWAKIKKLVYPCFPCFPCFPTFPTIPTFPCFPTFPTFPAFPASKARKQLSTKVWVDFQGGGLKINKNLRKSMIHANHWAHTKIYTNQ